MYLLLYYMLINSKNMISNFYKYLPFKRENLSIIATECRKMVRANAIGFTVVAIFQGFVSLIGFLIFGVADPFFWFVIIAIGSMIPFIGIMFVIIPVFLFTLSHVDDFITYCDIVFVITVVVMIDIV